jgi:predicted PhzF superfamily epimerase YddE/YHI9
VEVLSQLKPNIDLIKQWSIQHHVNGLYVYAEDRRHIITRNFNPKTGVVEDSGTGVAAGALALALKKDLLISQGEFIQQPSEIFVTYKNDEEIFVGGRVNFF